VTGTPLTIPPSPGFVGGGGSATTALFPGQRTPPRPDLQSGRPSLKGRVVKTSQPWIEGKGRVVKRNARGLRSREGAERQRCRGVDQPLDVTSFSPLVPAGAGIPAIHLGACGDARLVRSLVGVWYGDDGEPVDAGEVAGIAGVDGQIVRDGDGGDHGVVGACRRLASDPA